MARVGVVGAVHVTELDDLVRVVARAEKLRIVGSNSQARWRLPGSGACATVAVGLKGVVEHDVQDQVVVVRAGTTLADLQSHLAESGQCLPYLPVLPLSSKATVGGLASLNLVHALGYQCGSWRDWVIGMTVVRPDGAVAKCGSKVVKNVAGYDVMKLFVGARGTLGVIAELVLRTYPLQALPNSNVEVSGEFADAGWVQQTLASDFEAAVASASSEIIAICPGGSTLYTRSKPKRFAGDLVMAWGNGDDNLHIEDETLRKTMIRVKQSLDPDAKLNEGEFGFL